MELPAKIDYRVEFEPLFQQLSFTPRAIFKNGPRVLVAGGEWHRKKAIFKAPCGIATPKTSQGLKREAMFLESAPSYLRSMVPGVYKYGKVFGKRFWYLVGWVEPGDPQNTGGSDFLIKDTFFTQESLVWALELLKSLRRFSADVPAGLRKELSATVYNLSSYRRLLEGLGKEFFSTPTFNFKRTAAYLDRAGGVYNRLNLTTLVHHEFYGSQILASGRSFKLSDWENLGWGHPLRDFSTIWFRSLFHSAWQEEFLARFKKGILTEGKLREDEFEILFGVEKILQGFGNLNHFQNFPLPQEISVKEKALDFFRRQVLGCLG